MGSLDTRASIVTIHPSPKWIFGVLLLFALVTAQDEESTSPSSFLSEILSSLTSTGKAVACPGECIHAITSFFCDQVLEGVECGASYLRCCVPSNLSFGTPVETSPPLDEDEYDSPTNSPVILSHSQPTTTTTTTTTTTPPPSSTPSHRVPATIIVRPQGSPSVVKYTISPPSRYTPFKTPPTQRPAPMITTTSTTRRPLSPRPPMNPPRPIVITSEPTKVIELERRVCPGMCIDQRFSRYCGGNILPNSYCSDSRVCCLAEGGGGTHSVLHPKPTTSTTTTTTTTAPTTTTITTTPPPTMPPTQPPGPPCPGSCFAPLFSLLCDEISPDHYCPNDGRCCVTKEPTTTEPPVGPCPGSCIPTFLSGVCNRPSELIVKTSDCTAGTICCAVPKDQEQPPGQSQGSPPRQTNPQQQPNLPSHHPPIHQPPRPQPPGNFHPPHLSRPRPLPLPHPPHPPAAPSNAVHQHQPRPSIPQPVPAKPSIPPSAPPGRDEMTADGPPLCPGPCIAPFLRFTCFGTNSVYSGFACAKEGQVCCAPLADIQRYENMIRPGSAINPNPAGPASPTKVPVTFKPPPAAPATVRPNPYMCGIKGTQRRQSPRVVGGSDSVPGEWCWQIALINAQNQYLCGGALIGTQWVLTAAHCVTNLVRNGDAIYVRVGDYDLTSQYGSAGAQTQRVATTYIHHNHNSQTLDNDIALLKLQMPVELNENVCLICLPARGVNRQPGKRCKVTGYGYKSESGPIALKIREAELPIVEDQDCSVKINAVTEKLFILPASSYCAGGEEGNDACQGDGGGPMVCEVDGYYELTGLVSWGFGCGRADVPGVYVKVSSFIGWINQIISVNNL